MKEGEEERRKKKEKKKEDREKRKEERRKRKTRRGKRKTRREVISAKIFCVYVAVIARTRERKTTLGRDPC